MLYGGEEGCEPDVFPMTKKIDILLAQRTIFELMVSVLKRNILLTFSSSNNNCKLFLRKIREIIDQCLKYWLLLIVFYIWAYEWNDKVTMSNKFNIAREVLWTHSINKLFRVFFKKSTIRLHCSCFPVHFVKLFRTIF